MFCIESCNEIAVLPNDPSPINDTVKYNLMQLSDTVDKHCSMYYRLTRCTDRYVTRPEAWITLKLARLLSGHFTCISEIYFGY